MNKDKEKRDNVIKRAYKEYKLSPLPDVTNHVNNLLLKNGWCIRIGMSVVAPDPHRHFTFEEFEEKLIKDKKFANKFVFSRFGKL